MAPSSQKRLIVVGTDAFSNKEFSNIVNNSLATKINWMGGSVRRSLNTSTTTHLVAYRCAGNKVHDAALATRQIATVKSSWVEDAWNSRKSLSFNATESDFVTTHRAKVFQSTCLAFVGFNPGSTELLELCNLAVEHDGLVTENLQDERLTHVIVTDSWPGYGNMLEKLRELSLFGAISKRSSVAPQSNLMSPKPYHTTSQPDLMSGLSPTSSEPGSIMLNKSIDDGQRSISSASNFPNSRLPILRLEWFWLSLQFSCLCPIEPYLYVMEPPTVNPPNRCTDSQSLLLLPPLARPKSVEITLATSDSAYQSPNPTWSPAAMPPSLLTSHSATNQSHTSTPIQSVTDQREDHENPVPHCPTSTLSQSGLNQDATHPLGDNKENQLPALESHSSLYASLTVSPISTLLSSAKLHKMMSPAQSPTTMSSSLDKADKPTPQPSTPGSGKRKSSSRLSLLHSTARKSRTPASDLNLSKSVQPGGGGGMSQIGEVTTQDLQDTPIRIRLEKRQHRVFEFFVTERNYLEILRYLYEDAFHRVMDEDQPGGSILPRQEADYIFGKLGPILELHERLQPKLSHLEANWSQTESRLGDVLQLGLLDEMDRAYGNYMQFYSPPHLHQLGRQFPRFLAFMRQVERRTESGRQSLTALLVRPVQRLPSISLLMEGIAKFTPPNHPDYNDMKLFAQGINDLLTRINDRLRKNEERLSLLSLYHEISGAPPEMLSSSRSLVAKLNVFELGSNSSGTTTCEPVTLFLLSDSLEVARPRKRHTGEPLAHAIRAALAAVQGDGSDRPADSGRDPIDKAPPTTNASSTAHHNSGSSDTSGSVTSSSTGTTTAAATTTTVASSTTTASTSGTSVTRTGSGASVSSLTNIGLLEGKQRCYYKHLQLLKLHEIKRVVNFDTASPDRAAFGLVVRSTSELEDDRVHAYCLAASFAASIAVATGKCPDPIESAVSASIGSSQAGLSGPIEDERHVAKLQSCVADAKRWFLDKLCQLIVQASCLAHNPDDLLVDVEPEELLGVDLEQIFNATAVALTSRRLTRQLTRNISVKTPRRLAASAKRQFRTPRPTAPTPSSQHLQPPIATTEETNLAMYPLPSPRRSMLGSFLGSSCTSLSNFLNTALRTTNGNHGSTSLTRALQPPNRLALTPRPLRRIPSECRQGPYGLDLDLAEDDDDDEDEHIQEDDEDDDDEDGDLPFQHPGSSMLSLASWDSVATLDHPTRRRMDTLLLPSNRTTNTPNPKGSAIWETASHLGVTTAEERRRSFLRSPSSCCQFDSLNQTTMTSMSGSAAAAAGGAGAGLGLGSKKAKTIKKQKKPKLRAVSQLFQRSSLMPKTKDTSRKRSTDQLNRDSIDPSSNPTLPSSRRDSLLRGLFFR